MRSDNWIMAKHFDLDVMVTLITGVLEQATSKDIKDGRSFYTRANRFAHKQADRFKADIKVVTAVLSALSPESNWQENKDRTELIFEFGELATVTTYDNNKRKALKFIDGRLLPDDHYSSDNWIKTSCFYDNILNCLTSDRITIDRHAARAAHGYYLTGNESIFYINTRAKYIKTCEAYRIVAKQFNHRPMILQSIVWHTYRRLFSGNGKLATENREAYRPIIL